MQKNENFRVIWDGDSQPDCMEICRDLRRAGIAYKVAQQPVSRSIRMRVNWRFQVGVQDSDYEAARKVLGLSAVDDIVEDQTFEIPESPSSASSRPEYERRAHSYLKSWHPEKATVEVWSQVALETPSIVELALRENLIHYRLHRTENGKWKFFVLPEDEPRAREIVREIEKGEPPN
jgi:hypothetical protein